MPYQPGTRIIPQQQHHQYTERVFLQICSCISSPAIPIQATFIAHTNRVSIISANMRTRFFNRAKTLDIPVLPYIIMITRTGESPAQVVCD
mgnify:CR=1 FL=1